MIDATPFVKDLNGKPVAIFGMGASGMAVARALEAAGASVVTGDDAKGADELMRTDFKKFAYLILAPGVPLYYPQPHPVVLRAREAGVEIIGDIEVFSRCVSGHPIIAITGTNGKSTTTALTGHILKECGLAVQVGGNIGRAVFDLDSPAEGGVFVLEVSSYQMDLCPSFRPYIGVLLNITPDHIDRHGTFENYAAAKARMFEGAGHAVIAVDDPATSSIAKSVAASGLRDLVPVSITREAGGGIYVRDGILHDNMYDEQSIHFDLGRLARLPGVHNHQNAAAAYAVARLMGLAGADIFAAMSSFPGLPHRQYLVRTIGNVSYVNDSKATNADAASKALACYHDIFWIIGGRAKEGGLNGTEPFLDRIRHAFLIGEAAPEFSAWLAAHKIPYDMCDTLDAAVRNAHVRAQRHGTGVVLLSPACASFDQFRDFNHRGETFARTVGELS